MPANGRWDLIRRLKVKFGAGVDNCSSLIQIHARIHIY